MSTKAIVARVKVSLFEIGFSGRDQLALIYKEAYVCDRLSPVLQKSHGQFTKLRQLVLPNQIIDNSDAKPSKFER